MLDSCEPCSLHYHAHCLCTAQCSSRDGIQDTHTYNHSTLLPGAKYTAATSLVQTVLVRHILKHLGGQHAFWQNNQGPEACTVHSAFSMQVGAAGMVINTMGWVEGLGFQLLMHAIQAMQADVVLVVGQDRLFQQLQASQQVSRSPCLIDCGAY